MWSLDTRTPRTELRDAWLAIPLPSNSSLCNKAAELRVFIRGAMKYLCDEDEHLKLREHIQKMIKSGAATETAAHLSVGTKLLKQKLSAGLYEIISPLLARGRPTFWFTLRGSGKSLLAWLQEQRVPCYLIFLPENATNSNGSKHTHTHTKNN